LNSLRTVSHWMSTVCIVDTGVRVRAQSLDSPRPPRYKSLSLNPLTPNDDYSGRTAPLTSKCCILYTYSTNIGTEYFKHGIYSPFFLLQNAVCFIILTYLVPVVFTFYIQGVLKLKKNNSGAKRLTLRYYYNLWSSDSVVKKPKILARTIANRHHVTAVLRLLEKP